MTEDQFVEWLDSNDLESVGYDPEGVHYDADTKVAELLFSAGMDKAANAYLRHRKEWWYA